MSPWSVGCTTTYGDGGALSEALCEDAMCSRLGSDQRAALGVSFIEMAATVSLEKKVVLWQ